MHDPQPEFTPGPSFRPATVASAANSNDSGRVRGASRPEGGNRFYRSHRIRGPLSLTTVGVLLVWLGGSPVAEEAPFSGQFSRQIPSTGAIVEGPAVERSDGGGSDEAFEADTSDAESGVSQSRGPALRGGRTGAGGDRSGHGVRATGQGVGGPSHQLGGPIAGGMRGAEISRVASAGEVIGFSHVDASGSQRITLVDTGKSWMAVYHIGQTGTIRLVSSRPIDADFSLQLNATSPLPEEIRQLAGSSR